MRCTDDVAIYARAINARVASAQHVRYGMQQHRCGCGNVRLKVVLLGVCTSQPTFDFAVKDAFCTKDILTTCASKMLSNYVPPYDASAVAALYKAGMTFSHTSIDFLPPQAGVL